MKIEYHFAYKSLHATRGIADFIVLISSNNLVFKTSVRLEYLYTNSQAEFEPLQLWFTKFCRHGCKDINAFEDSLLKVQEIKSEF
jgi:hypothetical protein